MEENMKLLNKIIQGSKEYEMKGTVLTLRSYYSGEKIKLDLSMIDEYILESIMVPEGEECLDEDEW